jgi:thiol-disulfide isomerase/thioredoxin
MVHIVDVLHKYIGPYKRFLIFLLVFVILIFAIRYWLNRTLVEPTKFDDVANTTDGRKDAVIYFFHADWCPHCKKAQPEWNAFKTSYDRKVINGYTINCQDVNCTDENDSKSGTLINKYGVDSYPTVKMDRDNTIIDFDSKVTSTTLASFADMMLANK